MSEEAPCFAPTCMYNFTYNVPNITGVSPVYDSAGKSWNLHITGEGMGTDTAGIEFKVDGDLQ